VHIITSRFEVAAYSASIPAKVSISYYYAPFGCIYGQRITTPVYAGTGSANKVSRRKRIVIIV